MKYDPAALGGYAFGILTSIVFALMMKYTLEGNTLIAVPLAIMLMGTIATFLECARE